MKLKVSSILACSMVDYPGKVAYVVFCVGCNMRCKYCYNLDYVLKNKSDVEVEEIVEKIDTEFIDAVVISGGEPTLQGEVIIELARKCKDKGLLVKLDTNATNPEVVEEMINRGIVDYVAVDLKCRWGDYKELTGWDGNVIKENVLRIRDMCLDNGVFLEFRTTFLPGMDSGDLLELAETVRMCDLYAIQEFDNKLCYDEKWRKFPIPSINEMIKAGKVVKKWLYKGKVVVRTKNGVIKV